MEIQISNNAELVNVMITGDIEMMSIKILKPNYWR